jgi:hypothetical protein
MKVDSPPQAGFVSGSEHLLAELEILDLALRRQVLRLRAANQLTEDEYRGLYIADAQVDALIRWHAGASEMTRGSSTAWGAVTTFLCGG